MSDGFSPRENESSRRIVNVPNGISLVRLLLSPVLFTAIASQWHRTACSLFVIISLSDVLDGWWARKFNQVTAVGRVLDPLLDKVVVCGAMILLASSRGEIDSAIVSWMAVVVVVRELVVTAIRSELERMGHDFSAGVSGKLKMVLQCAGITMELCTRIWPSQSLHDATVWIILAAVIATIYSGVEYFIVAWRVVQKQGEKRS